jgi:hypothetical protein
MHLSPGIGLYLKQRKEIGKPKLLFFGEILELEKQDLFSKSSAIKKSLLQEITNGLITIVDKK